MALLFEPFHLRDLTVANRAWLAPMCQYSADDGVPGDWHLAHLGARAAGGFGLLIAEATAVVPEGRISPRDTGLWNQDQVAAWRRITEFVHGQGAAVGVQLAHAGRKASTYWPWAPTQGSVPPGEGGWTALGPTAEAFPGYAAPAAMTAEQVADLPEQFAAAARRAHAAGFDAVEVHAAHGYLLHQFLSPLTNRRTDGYGGTPENRARLLVETAAAVREAWPDGKPMLVRVSATDWTPGGLEVDDVVAAVKGLGADLVDVSTGGLVPSPVPVGPGYQVPHARRVRQAAGVPVAAVGLITSGEQAETVLRDEAADVVLIGRAALRDPHWAHRGAHDLRVAQNWPAQYERGAWR